MMMPFFPSVLHFCFIFALVCISLYRFIYKKEKIKPLILAGFLIVSSYPVLDVIDISTFFIIKKALLFFALSAVLIDRKYSSFRTMHYFATLFLADLLIIQQFAGGAFILSFWMVGMGLGYTVKRVSEEEGYLRNHFSLTSMILSFFTVVLAVLSYLFPYNLFLSRQLIGAALLFGSDVQIGMLGRVGRIGIPYIRLTIIQLLFLLQLIALLAASAYGRLLPEMNIAFISLLLGYFLLFAFNSNRLIKKNA